VTDDSSTSGPSFEAFRRSFYYGSRADMQFKFLASMSDDDAADTIARLLQLVGGAVDTGEWGSVQQAVLDAQVAAYRPAEPVEPEVADTPFAAPPASLGAVRLAVLTAGGVFRRGHDPLGPDGPTQAEVLEQISEYLRAAPELTEIPVDTPTGNLTARHPGYDATTAQRDPNTVFPLDVLRDLASEGRVHLAETHYSFVGATSQVRLRERAAPEWAQRLHAAQVGAALLVAT
jgi:hypothetical protein